MTKRRLQQLNRAEKVVEKKARALLRAVRMLGSLASEEETASILGEVPDFSLDLTSAVEEIFSALGTIRAIEGDFKEYERKIRKDLLRK